MNGHIMYDISSMGRAICSQRPWASAEGSSVVQLKVYDIEGPFFDHRPYLSIPFQYKEEFTKEDS